MWSKEIATPSLGVRNLGCALVPPWKTTQFELPASVVTHLLKMSMFRMLKYDYRDDGRPDGTISLSAPRPTVAIFVSGLLLRLSVAPGVLDGDVADVGEVGPESSSLLSLARRQTLHPSCLQSTLDRVFRFLSSLFVRVLN